MTTTEHPDGNPKAQHRGGDSSDPSTSEDSYFTEVIDPRTGSIRASGRLDTRAADMLSGTIAGLRRSGCKRVLLDLGGVQAADDAGLHAVHALERRVAASGGHVTLLNWPGSRTA